jgi:hypothetical protein
MLRGRVDKSGLSVGDQQRLQNAIRQPQTGAATTMVRAMKRISI